MTGVDTDLATLRDYAGWATTPASHKRAVKGVEAELSRLREQRDAHRNRYQTEAVERIKDVDRLCEQRSDLEWKWKAAEARCARLQQALAEATASKNRAHARLREALAGADTPADSQPEEPTT